MTDLGGLLPDAGDVERARAESDVDEVSSLWAELAAEWEPITAQYAVDLWVVRVGADAMSDQTSRAAFTGSGTTLVEALRTALAATRERYPQTQDPPGPPGPPPDGTQGSVSVSDAPDPARPSSPSTAATCRRAR